MAAVETDPFRCALPVSLPSCFPSGTSSSGPSFSPPAPPRRCRPSTKVVSAPTDRRALLERRRQARRTTISPEAAFMTPRAASVLLCAAALMGSHAGAQNLDVIYDEAKVPKYSLPDPLVM